MTDFGRTLQTAADAEGIARLLLRVAEGVRPSHSDIASLKHLSGRYRDYAAALREMAAADDKPEVADEQEALL